jgi:hypothetical protein
MPNEAALVEVTLRFTRFVPKAGDHEDGADRNGAGGRRPHEQSALFIRSTRTVPKPISTTTPMGDPYFEQRWHVECKSAPIAAHLRARPTDGGLDPGCSAGSVVVVIAAVSGQTRWVARCRKPWPVSSPHM